MKMLMVPKSRRSKALLLLSAIAGMAAAPALGQIRPMGLVAQQPPAQAKTAPQGARTAADAPVPGNPDYAPA